MENQVASFVMPAPRSVSPLLQRAHSEMPVSHPMRSDSLSESCRTIPRWSEDAMPLMQTTPRTAISAADRQGLSKDASISRLASGTLDATLKSLSEFAFGQNNTAFAGDLFAQNAAVQERRPDSPSPSPSEAVTNAPPTPVGTTRTPPVPANQAHASSTFSLPMVLVVD